MLVFKNKVFRGLSNLCRAQFYDKFPYDFKGLSKIVRAEQTHQFMQEVFGSNIDQCFIQAYNNLLQCIADPDSDQEDFINDNCEVELASLVLDVIGQNKLKLIYNPLVKPNLFYGYHNISLLIRKGPQDSYQFLSHPYLYLDTQDPQMVTERFPILEVGVQLRSQYCLTGENQQFDYQNFHFVAFQLQLDELIIDLDTQKFKPLIEKKNDHISSIEIMKEVAQMGDYKWLITEIDNSHLIKSNVFQK